MKFSSHKATSGALLGPGLRLSLALICIVALAIICVRYAIIAAEADSNTRFAFRVWPAHPAVLRAEIMGGVVSAASERGQLNAETRREIRLLSAEAPLDPTPFAVEAAVALRDGRDAKAEQLLIQARRRDPRDRGVRFLLAELYLRQNKVGPGLKELVALTKLSPETTASITDMLASYAHMPGAVPQLRRTLQLAPKIKSVLLSKLSEDAGNSALILDLARPISRSNDLLAWQNRLLASLIKAGEFPRALALWQQFSGQSQANVGNFADSKVSSPFTWTLLSSSDGSATATNRQLAVEYFGRSDAALASRTVLLPPGQYNLSFRQAESSADPAGIHWTVTCLSDGHSLLNAPLQRGSSGTSSFAFIVPADCSAERITLLGVAAVYPSEIDVTIADLAVRRRG